MKRKIVKETYPRSVETFRRLGCEIDNLVQTVPSCFNRIVRVEDLDQLERERDEFESKLSAMTANRNAPEEEISGLHKYINKLLIELNKPPLFKNTLGRN